MVYLCLLEDYGRSPPSLGFGKGGEVIGAMFRNAGKEVIGQFGVVDDD